MASLMDYAAAVTLALHAGDDDLLRPVSSNVSYLRSAGDADCFAYARIVRAGRRIATINTRAWQEDPGRPCAVSSYVFLRA